MTVKRKWEAATRMNPRLAYVYLLAASAASLPLVAQTTGSLGGMVLDPSGGALPDSDIKVEETATGAERRAMADRLGHYVVAGLPPGVYRIEVSRSGFRPETRADVEVPAGRTVRVDFTLTLGERRDSVVVSAELPLVSSSSSDWGGSIQRQTLESIPLKGRDMFDLVAQFPGATVPANAARTIFTGAATPISVNGARPWQNSFRLDGVYINGVAVTPSVNTGSYAAQTLAGPIDVTSLLHCGSNQLQVYNRDAAILVSGVIYSVSIDITECSVPTESTNFSSVKSLYR